MIANAYFASTRLGQETRGFFMPEVPYGRHSLISYLFVLVVSKTDRSGPGAVYVTHVTKRVL